MKLDDPCLERCAAFVISSPVFPVRIATFQYMNNSDIKRLSAFCSERIAQCSERLGMETCFIVIYYSFIKQETEYPFCDFICFGIQLHPPNYVCIVVRRAICDRP